MTMQPIWRAPAHQPGSSFHAEVGVRSGDELELETVAPQPFTQTIIVLKRRDVADLAAVLYQWLRESPPGRGGLIATPGEADYLEAAVKRARAEECIRDGCRHPMSEHTDAAGCWHGHCDCKRFR